MSQELVLEKYARYNPFFYLDEEVYKFKKRYIYTKYEEVTVEVYVNKNDKKDIVFQFHYMPVGYDFYTRDNNVFGLARMKADQIKSNPLYS